jgi:hypothetical protein
MRRSALHGLLLLLGALGLAGCVRLGPNFEPPREPWVETWNSPALDQVTHTVVQPDVQQWWSVFNDPVLDQLIADADANNTDIKVADCASSKRARSSVSRKAGVILRCSRPVRMLCIWIAARRRPKPAG